MMTTKVTSEFAMKLQAAVPAVEPEQKLGNALCVSHSKPIAECPGPEPTCPKCGKTRSRQLPLCRPCTAKAKEAARLAAAASESAPRTVDELRRVSDIPQSSAQTAQIEAAIADVEASAEWQAVVKAAKKPAPKKKAAKKKAVTKKVKETEEDRLRRLATLIVKKKVAPAKKVVASKEVAKKPAAKKAIKKAAAKKPVAKKAGQLLPGFGFGLARGIELLGMVKNGKLKDKPRVEARLSELRKAVAKGAKK